MTAATKPAIDCPPTPVTTLARAPRQETPADVTDANHFSLDMSHGMTRRALWPFTLNRSTLRPRTSTEILADLSQVDQSPEHTPSRSVTPTLCRRSHTPITSRPEPPVVLETPESNHTVTRLRVVKMETSPASGSKRSVDTEGDVRMRNGAWSSPDVAWYRQREEIRAMVTQSVHDNFEFERGRFADEIRGQLLATFVEDVKRLVHENFEAALARALGTPEEGETAAVQLVRERLGRMSDEARTRVFCTPEMLEVLKRLVSVLDLETRMGAWSLVEADENWLG